MPTACSTWHFFNGRDQSENNTWRVGDCAPVLPGLGRLRLAATATTSAHSWKGWPPTTIFGWPSYRCRPARFWSRGTAPRRGVSLADHCTSRIASRSTCGRRNRNSTATYADLFWLLVSANTNGRSIVGVASAFADRSRLLPDGHGSALRAAKHGCGERGRGDPRLLRGASNARGARQSRRGMRRTVWIRFSCDRRMAK